MCLEIFQEFVDSFPVDLVLGRVWSRTSMLVRASSVNVIKPYTYIKRTKKK